jgi:two-component system LytT family response regulator
MSGVPPTLRVLVVDDEAPARRKLRRLLGAIGGVEVIGEAATGEQAIDQIAALTPDLVLLDVQMPVLDGFEVIAAIGVEQMPAVVSVTAFDEHAVRAFEVRALDYLLKPVSEERLREAVDRVRARAHSGSGAVTDVVRAALTSIAESRPLTRILVHDERSARLLPVEAITLARARRNYVTLYATTGTFTVRCTIAALAQRLDPTKFLQVNRSDVIQLDSIRELQPWSHGDYRIVLGDGTALLWSRRFRASAAGTFDLSAPR